MHCVGWYTRVEIVWNVRSRSLHGRRILSHEIKPPPPFPMPGDPQVMLRLMGLLAAPLADWQALSYEQYAEWVAVRFKVGLLQAHAQVSGGGHGADMG